MAFCNRRKFFFTTNCRAGQASAETNSCFLLEIIFRKMFDQHVLYEIQLLKTKITIKSQVKNGKSMEFSIYYQIGQPLLPIFVKRSLRLCRFYNNYPL